MKTAFRNRHAWLLAAAMIGGFAAHRRIQFILADFVGIYYPPVLILAAFVFGGLAILPFAMLVMSGGGDGPAAIGEAGAANAGLMAASILALTDAGLRDRLVAWRAAQSDKVPENPQ